MHFLEVGTVQTAKFKYILNFATTYRRTNGQYVKNTEDKETLNLIAGISERVNSKVEYRTYVRIWLKQMIC